jgi:CRISPR-associated protein Cmr2
MEPIKYTAVTIGPIYKVFSQARKTRELWGASYLFSFIMRRIIEKLNDLPKCCLPYKVKIIEESKGKGAGFFPDRLIIEGDVKGRIQKIEEEIFFEIADNCNLSEDYLHNYLRIYVVTFTLPVNISNKEEENNNIVIVANKLLDSIELKEKYFQKITDINWRTAIDSLNRKIFYTEAFIGKSNDFQFPSIIEIATDDFRKKNKDQYYRLVRTVLNAPRQSNIPEEKQDEINQKEFVKGLNNNKDFLPIKLRPYHKYIAVVQADGDNTGKTIAKIGNNPDMVRKFSSALFDFAIFAAEKIKKYGGKAVYIGGDDLLFFAPVAVWRENSNEVLGHIESIFKLINDIDIIFKNKIIECNDLKHLYLKGGILEKNVPSMSYGVSITYSKYPLNEARDSAESLLREAKKIRDDKNKICFQLNKHSGQGYGFTIDKKLYSGNPIKPLSFDYFLSMVSNIPLQENLLSSIIYKLKPMHGLLNQISTDKERLNIFFAQEFDLDKKEPSQMTPEEKAKEFFIKNIVAFYHQLSVDFPNDNKPLPAQETEQDKSNTGKLYSTLRFLKHLTDEEDES